MATAGVAPAAAHNEQPSHLAHAAHSKLEQIEASFNPENQRAIAAAKRSEEPGFTSIRRTETGYGQVPEVPEADGNLVQIISGPLLNYRRTRDPDGAEPRWHGSVLVVSRTGGKQPVLQLRRLENVIAKDSETANGAPHSAQGESFSQNSSAPETPATKLYADREKTFWCFEVSVPLAEHETRWEYSIPSVEFVYEAKLTSGSRSFVVPAASQSMRIMFHSCNGFSVGVDTDDWAGGPVLWKDVLRMHEQKPFHVMLGGGDQIYNDSVRVTGPLQEWTAISNPKKRRDYPFGRQMRDDCDKFYYDNYVRWYNTDPFAVANGQIPQINIWDDHDIIDGFGSYTDHFMRCPVFRGIGGVAFKYYCLFQHHLPPPRSTFTTDAPETMHGLGLDGPGIDEHQLTDVYVHKTKDVDPSFIIGKKSGPYVEERSRSIYARLGARIAFLGIDARTERTRHQVNYPETYDLLFQRVDDELTAAKGKIKHFVLLLGIPIAYPRLSWLENVINSPIIGPIRVLNKRFGLAGGLFNKFDGQVEILDDLDDHYTAHAHKAERKQLIHRLQVIAQKHSVRVTILGGDVHLAAAGRFYSKPQRELTIEQDHRFMANVISSAITNKPPPQLLANFMARRNRIHRLDLDTHETLFKLFDRDPGIDKGASKKTDTKNYVTMPSRNYAIISEAPTEPLVPATNGIGIGGGGGGGGGGSGSGGSGSGGSGSGSGSTSQPAEATQGSHGLLNGNDGGPTVAETTDTTTTAPDWQKTSHPKLHSRTHNAGHSALHEGEENAGTKHAAASGLHAGPLIGGLDISIRVEIDQHDPQGRTEGYGFSIPQLRVAGAKEHGFLPGARERMHLHRDREKEGNGRPGSGGSKPASPRS